MMNATLDPPPASPGVDALAAAHTLLAIAADPAACKARLDELTAQYDAIKKAAADLDRARKKLDAARVDVADLEKREHAVTQAAEAQATASQQLANAGSAQAERDRALSKKEAELDRREKAVEHRERDHTRRVEQAKAALG
jgi:colicin import membrane protein